MTLSSPLKWHFWINIYPHGLSRSLGQYWRMTCRKRRQCRAWSNWHITLKTPCYVQTLRLTLRLFYSKGGSHFEGGRLFIQSMAREKPRRTAGNRRLCSTVERSWKERENERLEERKVRKNRRKKKRCGELEQIKRAVQILKKKDGRGIKKGNSQ